MENNNVYVFLFPRCVCACVWACGGRVEETCVWSAAGREL